jgi:hypothetical protein
MTREKNRQHASILTHFNIASMLTVWHNRTPHTQTTTEKQLLRLLQTITDYYRLLQTQSANKSKPKPKKQTNPNPSVVCN